MPLLQIIDGEPAALVLCSLLYKFVIPFDGFEQPANPRPGNRIKPSV